MKTALSDVKMTKWSFSANLFPFENTETLSLKKYFETLERRDRNNEA